MNVHQRIGGDSDLSPRGMAYARALPQFFRANVPPDTNMTVRARWLARGGKAPLREWRQGRGGAATYSRLECPAVRPRKAPPQVWTSTFKRTRQTGQFLPYAHMEWRALDEIDAGVCDGLTYEEIAVRLA